MKNKILFYSSVETIELFDTQKFYKTDINILVDLGFDVYVTNRILDFLFFWKYNVAFIYFFRYGFFASVLARMFGKRVYFTGGIDDLDKSYATSRRYRIQKWFFRLCYLFSTKCIIVSKSDCKNVRKVFKGILPSKIALSFHTIEVDDFLCDTQQIKGNDFTTIAWMGDDVNVIRKGVDLSLKLFSQLLTNYSEYKLSKFIIIGRKGAGTTYLKSLCNELNICDKVVFTDEVDELTKINILKRSRYYLQLSKYEGFGIAAIEALAAQNIVINSGRGGLSDSIGKHGVLVDIDVDITKQIAQIHEKIQFVDSEFLKIGEQYVVNNFSYDLRRTDFEKIIFSKTES